MTLVALVDCTPARPALVAPGRGANPYHDDGVAVRPIIHKERSVVIENDNGRFKDHFDVNGPVPIRSQAATAHWVLGAVRDYHVTLLHRHNLGLDFRVGPKPELQVA